jgi:hypothetical protein
MSAHHLFSGDLDQNNSTWLYDFLSKGVQAVYAEYSIVPVPEGKISDQYYKQYSYSASYSSTDKKFELRFLYEYRDDWNVLTRNGAQQPPKQNTVYSSSKVHPWTNSNGLGVYTEKFERQIPNWLVFEGLDSLIMIQCKLGNQRPSLSGIFFQDELKYLKKLYKENDGSQDVLTAAFEFDPQGNVTEISKSYLDGYNSKRTNQAKNIQDYTLSIRNKDESLVFVEVLTNGAKYPLIEGLKFKSGDKTSVIFNFDLNRLFHKFVPELVADPEKLILEYIAALQSVSSKPFTRLESTAVK